MASESPSQPGWEDVVKIVTSWYPDLLNRTYPVPPTHFNKVPYVRRNVPGTGLSAQVIDDPSGDEPPKHDAPPESLPALPAAPKSMFNQQLQTPVRVRESDFRDDFAQNHVLYNLKAFGDNKREVMVILSRLSFGNYLNQPAYAAAAAHLPQPSELDTEKIQYSDGEADLVLIHRKHGILVGEIKSVGKHQTEVPDNDGINKRIEKAVKQLDRSAKVMRHLVKDVTPGLAVRTALFLPYISSDQLKQALLADVNLEHAACMSLGAVNAAEAVKLSCCSNQLSNPDTFWDVTSGVLSRLATWWECRMMYPVIATLPKELYTHIVARFVGPASTVNVQCNFSPRVEVRTKGQLVAELGWRLAQLILTLEQLDLMNRDHSLVCITGPPGTEAGKDKEEGKTVVLVLQALRWILQGQDVHVVSTRPTSRAVSILIRHQITNTATKTATPQQQQSGKAILHNYDVINHPEDVTRAVKELSEAAGRDGKLCVILDEAVFDRSTKQGPLHKDLVTQLIDAVPQLYFWTACVLYEGIPEQLRTEVFTTPLRCAPVVIRELQPAISRFNVHKYSNKAIPSPADGPSVIRLSHHGKGHVGRWPVECPQCGCDVAAELGLLGVGTKGSDLSYHDVFVLTRSSELQDHVKDDAETVRSPASGVVLGLRATNLPVDVLARQIRGQDRKRWEREMEGVALAKSDRIVVAHGGEVTGLERKIVVTLQGHFSGADERSSHADIDSSDKLLAVSRCTTQLIVVTVPASNEPDLVSSTSRLARSQNKIIPSDSSHRSNIKCKSLPNIVPQDTFRSACVNTTLRAKSATEINKTHNLSSGSRSCLTMEPPWKQQEFWGEKRCKNKTKSQKANK